MQIQNTNAHTPRTMRGAIPRVQNLRFATVSRNRRDGSSGKIKMRLSLQRRAQKCMKRAIGVGGRPWHTKIIVLPQSRTSDQHEVTKGLPDHVQNLCFTTVLDVRRERSDERVKNICYHSVVRLIENSCPFWPHWSPMFQVC